LRHTEHHSASHGRAVASLHQRDDETACQSAGTMCQLSKDQWREWLCLYPEDEIHFSRLDYGNGSLRALIVPHAPRYTLAHPNYFTASQLVLITSQICYMLAGAAFLDHAFTRLPRDLYPTFMQKLRGTEIYYTGMNISFRRRIPNYAPLLALGRIESTRLMRQLLLVRASLSFAGESCFVTPTLVMQVDSKT